MTSTFKNFVKLALTTCALTFTLAQNAHSGVLRDGQVGAAKATLETITEQIYTAVGRAKNLFANRASLADGGITYSSTSSKTIENMLSGTDMYLQHLKITDSRAIQIQYVDNSMGGNVRSNLRAPVFGQLNGKKILLVPIVQPGDETISEFECLTDADDGFTQFVNDKGTPAGQQSFISEYTDNKYLGKCQYITTTTMNGLWVE